MSRATSIKQLIEQQRQQIADAEREIGRLVALDHRLVHGATPYGAIKQEIPQQVTALRQQIEGWRAGIESLQSQLPMIEATEQAAANINANLEAAEREREAARMAERDTNLKEAARANYLQSGGDPMQFESAWPGIQQGIAMSNARAAAETALQAPTSGGRVQAMVKGHLAMIYRQPVPVKGGNDDRQN